jgi:K+-transporting ATPase ATPase B chain
MTTTPTLPSRADQPATQARAAANQAAQRQQPARKRPLFDPGIVQRAIQDAFVKLNPRHMVRNPVMFVVLIGATYTLFVAARDIAARNAEWGFTLQLTLWLWFTVLFANFAEAMAEGRGKAQAATLRRSRTQTTARRLVAQGNGRIDRSRFDDVPAEKLRRGEIVLCLPGDVIPGDGEVIDGVASVDESAITGESAPVIRESGGDRSAVTGGTKVLSDYIVVRITANPGETFLDRMIALVEGASRQKTPNEIALTILLSGLTIVFLIAVATLQPFAIYSGGATTIPILIALLVCLIPTTIGGLLSAIGIAGKDRMIQQNVIAMSGRAVEAAGDVNTLLLDKTGTITLGNRQASEFMPLAGVPAELLADRAQLASLADETPEGRSIVVLAKTNFGIRGREIGAEHDGHRDVTFIPFSASTRMSGVDTEGYQVRKGAGDAVLTWVRQQGGRTPADLETTIQRIAMEGGTPLVVAERANGENGHAAGGARVLGVVYLKDIVKGGIRERFDRLRAMGIRTVMITGDNPLTAAAIAKEAGVDDFLAEAQPEDKMALIKREQAGGRLVAMTGDGTNDAPALALADVGVAMNTGTQAAKEAGNMIDLDSNPTKLIEIVEIGKQLLMTRGSLTTFSIANDVAKYFAIIPAMFVTTYPVLQTLNIMRLHSPQSAILASVIFNALIIIALIPLALRGVSYRPAPAAAILRRNLWRYGAGGLVVPFIGIKIIDVLLVLTRLVS